MSCKIRLDNDNETYLPGSTITGKFQCNFRTDQDVKAIKIKLSGIERVYWTETNTFNRTTTYWAVNELLLSEIKVHTGGHVAAGWYNYDFSLKLPDILPSSFKGRYGYIKYSITGTVERPTLKMNFTDENTIKILSLVDLNGCLHNPMINQRPLVTSQEKKLYNCCFSRGKVNLEVALEKMMFAVGENINIRLKVNNESSIDITEIKTKLTQLVTFTAVNKTKSEKKTVVKKKMQVEKGQRNVNEYHVQLPLYKTANVYNMFGCQLFTVNYFLTVICSFSGMHVAMKLENIVILGHIPIGQFPIDREAWVYSEGILKRSNPNPSTSQNDASQLPSEDEKPPAYNPS